MTIDSSYSYRQGFDYEIFMRRAFQTSNTSKPGMHGSAMQNLIDAENGQIVLKQLGSFEKQLIQVKKYMQTALDKYLKMNLPSDTLEMFKKMKVQVDAAISTSDLIKVIGMTIELTQSVK